MAICSSCSSSCSSFQAAWLGSPTRSVPNHWVEALTFRLAINLRYVEILLFHVIWGFYKWGHSWKPMESQGGLVSPKSFFLKPARFPFQMIFIGADSRRKEPVFSLTHLRLWVVKTWYMSSLVMSGRGIPSYRDTKITSTWVLIQSWFWNSPRILHLFPTPDPSAPSAQGFRTFARFRPLSLQA